MKYMSIAHFSRPPPVSELQSMHSRIAEAGGRAGNVEEWELEGQLRTSLNSRPDEHHIFTGGIRQAP